MKKIPLMCSSTFYFCLVFCVLSKLDICYRSFPNATNILLSIVISLYETKMNVFQRFTLIPNMTCKSKVPFVHFSYTTWRQQGVSHKSYSISHRSKYWNFEFMDSQHIRYVRDMGIYEHILYFSTLCSLLHFVLL